MSRREFSGIKNRKTNFRRWQNRFSVGGANRTSVNNQIRQFHGNSTSRHADSPNPPSTSRLPYDRYRYRRKNENEEEYDLGSPSQYRDERGRPIQRVGLFRNAKHSDVVRPYVNEKMVRNVEAQIRRITRPESFIETREAPNSVRDRVRSIVYEMGPRKEYGNYERNYPPNGYEGRARRCLFSPPVVRYINPKKNVLYDSGYEPRSVDHSRRDEYDYLPDERMDYNFGDRYKKNESRSKRDREIEEFGEKRKKDIRRSSSSEDEMEEPRFSQHHGKTFSRYPSPRSEARKEMEMKRCDSPVVYRTKRSQKYESDEKKEEEKWRKSLPFINDENGDGVNIIGRIGNIMPHLPLMDNSEKSYSKIAFFLIRQSIHNSAARQSPKENGSSKVFNKLVNMSTSWVGSKNFSTILAGGGEFARSKPPNTPIFGNDVVRKEIMRDISKIEHPQSLLVNNTGLNESVLANSGLVEEGIFGAMRKGNGNRALWHSSPKGGDIRADEIEISSVREKGSSGNEDIHHEILENDSDGEMERNEMMCDNYVDDYIEKGASQLSYINTPLIQSSASSPEYNFSKDFRNETEELDEIIFASKTGLKSCEEEKSADLFDLFNTSMGNSEPLMKVNEETKRMFDNAFNEYQEQEKQKLLSINRHLFS